MNIHLCYEYVLMLISIMYVYIYLYTPTLRGRQSLCCIQGFLTWTQTFTDGRETLCYVWAKI